MRDQVLNLRAQDRSVKEIADALTEAGTPISHQSVWVICIQEGLERWPEASSVECAHAGLFVLFPAMIELGVAEIIAAGGYPSTTALSAWHSMASLLVLKLLRANRVSHATSLAADAALGLAVGSTCGPKPPTPPATPTGPGAR